MKIVALTGGSGSGKSTILEGLKEYFGDEITILSLDDYYRPKSELPVDDKGETNFDLPEVINYVNLMNDITRLKAGEVVELDTYTYNRTAMTSSHIKVKPAKWLVVEGLFALYDDDIRAMVDIKAFIDASVDKRLERRKHRDLTIRGYSAEEVQYQWDNHVRPADIKFIEPWKEKCDVVINNEEHWEHGLRELIYNMESI
ncbi:MAG: uridine kinase [Bacteroidetes bacterium]|nr:MAG: uridine kinase [Bacteroidota bacterium]